MASLRNLAIGILRAHGQRNIAAALRRYARDATRSHQCVASQAREPDTPALHRRPGPARQHQPARHRTADVQGVLAGMARCFPPGCQRRDRDRAL
jgi:hypothetical protein